MIVTQLTEVLQQMPSEAVVPLEADGAARLCNWRWDPSKL